MVKTKTEEKTAEPEKPQNLICSSCENSGFLLTLKRLGKPSTSREISDALGIKNAENGRAIVRREMEKLIEAGKVKVTEAEKGRARLYSLT
jgi:predicted ArsR family transcriptional regulator